MVFVHAWTQRGALCQRIERLQMVRDCCSGDGLKRNCGGRTALWVLYAGQYAVIPGDCGNAEKMLASMLDFVTIRELLHGAGARVYTLF